MFIAVIHCHLVVYLYYSTPKAQDYVQKQVFCLMKVRRESRRGEQCWLANSNKADANLWYGVYFVMSIVGRDTRLGKDRSHHFSVGFDARHDELAKFLLH